ncbi:hypothetical protein JB92DRAFT_2925947 [Gautieria morchelliformis]|nr:hypothetical protein JB92DRAFT_2925947 [Gautieria morchelliformis]
MSFRLGHKLLPKVGRHTSPHTVRTRPLFTRAPNTVRNILSATALVTGTGLFLVYYFDSRSSIHRYVLTPILRTSLDAETSHQAALKILRSGWAPKDKGVDDESLAVELWGERLSNPVGLAAGFDKDGEAIDGLFDLGFGWVEVGSVTPKAQPGNPRPRVFHLPEDDALINRYGFPSKGHAFLASRLRARYAALDVPSTSSGPYHLLSVNLGKNKSSPPDSVTDYLAGVRAFAPLSPVLVINVSSPNTPGLRALQGRELLEELLHKATKERDAVAETSGKRARLVLKVAPDLDDIAVQELAEVVRNSGVDGVIVSNTTIARPDALVSPNKGELGGLSGIPLKPITLRTLSLIRSFLPSSIPIIGCGGISSGADALEYARAGASAVQLYTAFGYGGVGTPRRIKDEIAEELKRQGTTWADISRDAIDRLSWKAPIVNGSATEAGDGVAALIREAEELKRLLDDVATRFTEDDKRVSEGLAGRSGAGISGGGSEEDLHPADVSTLPPAPPPGVSS